jgi:hypothetical protein
VIEEGMVEAGVFQRMSSFEDIRLAEVFAREMLRFFIGLGLMILE